MSGPPTIATKPSANRPRNPARRRFLRRALIGAGVVLGGGSAWSLFGERAWLGAHQVSIPIPDLPPALDGFTIAHLSDMHRGPYISERHLREAVRMAMSYAPDMVVLTGDHISLHAKYAKSCADALSQLNAEHGVYGILGNHEYWTDEVARVTDAYRDAGVKMLINEAAPIVTGNTLWWLCGLDDMWRGSADLDATLANVPEEHFRILLCHEPDYADEAAKRGIPLQLSGHSHGGQVRLPGIGPVLLPIYSYKYPYLLQRVPNTRTQVYTTTGVGVTFPPVRINCRPEVAILRLRKP
jgi:predicted MPP superfamily phosphohydrolase